MRLRVFSANAQLRGPQDVLSILHLRLQDGIIEVELLIMIESHESLTN